MGFWRRYGKSIMKSLRVCNVISLSSYSEEMNNYALSEDNSGKKSYVRFNSRAGESVTLNNVRIDSSTMKELKDAVSY